MSAVKRTERGWPGHFICSDRCKFRLNTLLEYDDKKIVVSTIGNMYIDGKPETIGYRRWYETMVFYAYQDGYYIEADVSRQLYPDQDWGIWADIYDELPNDVDNVANQMHESIVQEFIQKLESGEV